jgi:hypothetical protein
MGRRREENPNRSKERSGGAYFTLRKPGGKAGFF